MTSRTMYEVYDKSTGAAVRYKRNGEPCRMEYETNAEFIIISANNNNEPLYYATHATFNIPAGAEVAVRTVSVEVDP